MSAVLHLRDERDTESLGRRLARTLPASAVVFLHGQLGAGKSTLARALLRELGVAGSIKSPTYALIERYPLPGGDAVHIDLYRIATVDELEFLGLDTLSTEARLWLVEWPERGAAALPPPDLEIFIAIDGDGRRTELRAKSRRGDEWLTAAGGGESEPTH